MKKLAIRNYKGFTTTFFITPNVEKYLQDNKINVDKYIPDTEKWYEKYMFDFLNPDINKTWSETTEKRKNFNVIINYVMYWKDEDVPTGLAYNKVEISRSKFLHEWIINIKIAKKPIEVHAIIVEVE